MLKLFLSFFFVIYAMTSVCIFDFSKEGSGGEANELI